MYVIINSLYTKVYFLHGICFSAISDFFGSVFYSLDQADFNRIKTCNRPVFDWFSHEPYTIQGQARFLIVLQHTNVL